MDARFQQDNLIFLRVTDTRMYGEPTEFEVQEHKDYPDSTRHFGIEKKSVRRVIEMAEPGDLINVGQNDYTREVADEVEIPALSPRALLKRIRELEEKIASM